MPKTQTSIDPDAPFRPQMTARDDAGHLHAIDRQTQARAFLAWSAARPRGRDGLNYGALGHVVDRLSTTRWSGKWAFGRLADRMVQNLRKADWIELNKPGRGWRLTETGAAARDLLARRRQAGK